MQMTSKGRNCMLSASAQLPEIREANDQMLNIYRVF